MTKSNDDDILGKKILTIYETGSKSLSETEISKLAKDYEAKANEVSKDNNEPLKHELDLQEGAGRYIAYTRAFSRAFRYLAFTSDFGEALRPVIATRIVNASYGLSIGYCFTDVAWEAYKLHNRGYVTETKQPMTLTQCVVERSTFQLIASLIVPAVLIHTTVDIGKHLFKRIGRFQRFGPSILGLSMIPFLPLYLDHPVESGIEYVFERYGPWAHHSDKSHKD